LLAASKNSCTPLEPSEEMSVSTCAKKQPLVSVPRSALETSLGSFFDRRTSTARAIESSRKPISGSFATCACAPKRSDRLTHE
jgi:hypothetical protein